MTQAIAPIQPAITDLAPVEPPAADAVEVAAEREVQHLTHSRCQAYLTCPRKHALAYELRLRPLFDPDPLRQGSAFHEGIELLKMGYTENEALRHVANIYLNADCPPWMTPEDLLIEAHMMMAMVAAWGRRWANDMITDYVEVELPFSLPIINPTTGRTTPTFNSAGKIDGIVRLNDNRLALIEHKTTGDSIEDDSDYWGTLVMDNQVSRYVWAARSKGYEVETTIYDVTRKPGIRPRKISNADRALATSQGNYFGIELHETCPEHETPAMYGARCLDDMMKRPEFYFARKEVPRIEADLNAFHAEQWMLMQQIRSAQLASRQWGLAAWPRNTRACTAMGTCPYFKVCRGDLGDPIEHVPAGLKRVSDAHPELSMSRRPKVFMGDGE